MPEILTHCVDRLTPPPLAARAAAEAAPATQAAHDRLRAAWPCLNAVEVRQPPARPSGAATVATVCAWNLERCKHVEASAALLAARGADVVLATEMDCGMARAHQRHTTAGLAGLLGMGYAFAVEFVELGLGDDRERADCAGQENRDGLHGNAVLSRWPILRAARIALDDGGAWWRADMKQGQRRVGGRCAVAVQIDAPFGPFWAVSVHFESVSTRQSRAAEATRLLAALATLGATGAATPGATGAVTLDAEGAATLGVDAAAAPGAKGAAVIGGDLNTRDAPPDDLAALAQHEPAFAAFAAGGFAWEGAVGPGATTRNHPWAAQDRPGRKLDWLLARGMTARRPWIAPALGADGATLSDHEAVGATVAP